MYWYTRSKSHKVKLSEPACYWWYDNQSLPSTINSYNPHLFWFPALCPETFSFTLSEVLQTGIPIIASKIGSFPERLKYRTNVILHNSASSNYEISELIKEISHELNKLKWSYFV